MGPGPCQWGGKSAGSGRQVAELVCGQVYRRERSWRAASGFGNRTASLAPGGPKTMALSGSLETTNPASKMWIGVAIGAAVGIGIALSRRKRTRWETARELMTDRSGDLAHTTRAIADRVKNIYAETRKVVEEASELWAHGRRL